MTTNSDLLTQLVEEARRVQARVANLDARTVARQEARTVGLDALSALLSGASPAEGPTDAPEAVETPPAASEPAADSEAAWASLDASIAARKAAEAEAAEAALVASRRAEEIAALKAEPLPTHDFAASNEPDVDEAMRAMLNGA